MKIVNRTHWKTSSLKPIVSRVAREELTTRRRKLMTVYIDYKKGHANVAGRAPYDGFYVKMFVCRDRVPSSHFAYVLAHEFGHIRGQRHRNMDKRHKWEGLHSGLFDWAKEFVIEQKPEKAKFKPDDATKFTHAQRRLEIAKTRLKRAKTIYKKWEKKVRYYDKKLAATALNS